MYAPWLRLCTRQGGWGLWIDALPTPLIPPTPLPQIPQRFLMGPGPGNADPRILAAQSLPLLGHMCVGGLGVAVGVAWIISWGKFFEERPVRGLEVRPSPHDQGPASGRPCRPR